KMIGGVHYTYSVKGFETQTDQQWKVHPLPDSLQQQALLALLQTLHTHHLEIPDHIRNIIPPQPPGYRRDRETFKTYTGLLFDPLAAAESAAGHTLSFLLNPQRLARLVEQKAADPNRTMSVNYVLEQLLSRAFLNERKTIYQEEIARAVEKLTIQHIIRLAADKTANKQLTALALYQLDQLSRDLLRKLENETVAERRAHLLYMLDEISRFRQHPKDYQPPKVPTLPAGSPIGCGG
ncbi:MAG TPA: peptidase, partial [Bacteroidetes bacterium]|nr:peptidase [Bacteroidota bacterium]